MKSAWKESIDQAAGAYMDNRPATTGKP